MEHSSRLNDSGSRRLSKKAEVVEGIGFTRDVDLCYIEQVAGPSKQTQPTFTEANVSSGDHWPTSACCFTMLLKSCCIYTIGVFSILILISGIVLVLSDVFPHIVQSVVKKVSILFRLTFYNWR